MSPNHRIVIQACFVHWPPVMKRTLWALALAVFFVSVVGVNVVAQPTEAKITPTPYTTLQSVTVYSL